MLMVVVMHEILVLRKEVLPQGIVIVGTEYSRNFRVDEVAADYPGSIFMHYHIGIDEPDDIAIRMLNAEIARGCHTFVAFSVYDSCTQICCNPRRIVMRAIVDNEYLDNLAPFPGSDKGRQAQLQEFLTVVHWHDDTYSIFSGNFFIHNYGCPYHFL